MTGEVIDEQIPREGQAKRLHLPLKIGRSEERRVPALEGVKIVTIVQIVALELGCAVEELIILREGEELPLDPGTIIGPDYPQHRRHHIHYKSPVKVSVNYNAASHHREFKRQDTVEDVLLWAIKVFNIDPAMVPEFELALHGSKDELPATEHIGHLAGRCDELDLDLIRGTFVNGAAP